MECEYCNAEDEHKEIIYQDAEVIVAVKDSVTTAGQITIFPKKHFTIMELVPEDILAKCVSLANKVGVAVFESLDAHGSNLIIQNGLAAGQKVPHFAIEIIPRREGDGINFQWEPKQLMEDEMDHAYQQLKEENEKYNAAPAKPEPAQESSAAEPENKNSADNYLVKVLKRRP